MATCGSSRHPERKTLCSYYPSLALVSYTASQEHAWLHNVLSLLARSSVEQYQPACTHITEITTQEHGNKIISQAFTTRNIFLL